MSVSSTLSSQVRQTRFYRDIADTGIVAHRRSVAYNAASRREVEMGGLSAKSCVPCRGGVPALTGEQIKPLLAQLDGWNVVDEHHLERNYEFPDFITALAFVNKVGEVAEAEGHHPDIYLTWGRVGIRIFTHKIDGLTESDFILAAKLDDLPRA